MLESKNVSYIYYLKCVCGLEFVVLSWKSNWRDTHLPFCPECGKQINDLLKIKASENQICSLKGKILSL